MSYLCVLGVSACRGSGAGVKLFGRSDACFPIQSFQKRAVTQTRNFTLFKVTFLEPEGSRGGSRRSIFLLLHRTESDPTSRTDYIKNAALMHLLNYSHLISSPKLNVSVWPKGLTTSQKKTLWYTRDYLFKAYFNCFIIRSWCFFFSQHPFCSPLLFK